MMIHEISYRHTSLLTSISTDNMTVSIFSTDVRQRKEMDKRIPSIVYQNKIIKSLFDLSIDLHSIVHDGHCCQK